MAEPMENSMARPPVLAIAQYGLAYLGVHLAFMPLLVLLVPRRVEALGTGDAATMVSWLLLSGAIVAGASHIAAGHASDRWLARHGTRRGLIAIGAGLLALSYGALAWAGSFAALLVGIALFQCALNFAFAPLGALLTDHFPDRSKGLMAGIMHAAMPASTLAVVLVGRLFPQDGPSGFLFAGGLSVACFAPLLLAWKLGLVAAAAPADPDRPTIPAQWAKRDFAIAWGAKLAVQLGATFVSGYIYLYLAAAVANRTTDPQASATSLLADISWPAGIIAVLATLTAGVLSDRARRRRVPLTLAATAVAGGLVLLSQAGGGTTLLLGGYCLFYVGLSVFTSIDTAMVAQIVSGHRHRGTLLGVLNLTNTLPSAIAPALALLAFQPGALAPVLGQLFLGCAVLALMAGGAILFVRSVR
ncbi:MFS transporter [Altererythrobacter sp. KTW20L]|uniref:MFS transporter n=1 Tax=Altererythrobacter sp. KTW20L TaxID=2942210 RepID=UPI0020BD69F0|nr:MFS transporter [Altererythrobacter sp. KTW20L]